MKLSSLGSLLLATVWIVAASPAPRVQLNKASRSIGDINGIKKASDSCSNVYCIGTTNSSQSERYVCGDPRLGPVHLPTQLPLCALTSTYDRFGGLCPGEFLAKWTVKGSYVYPPKDGFLLSTSNSPIYGNIILHVGMQLDRFGSDRGTYTSPARTSYSERALSNLDTPVSVNGPIGKYPFNYHLYVVKKEIVVLAGPIAPWFGQPGMGTQYKMAKNVKTYIDEGALGEVELNRGH